MIPPCRSKAHTRAHPSCLRPSWWSSRARGTPACMSRARAPSVSNGTTCSPASCQPSVPVAAATDRHLRRPVNPRDGAACPHPPRGHHHLLQSGQRPRRATGHRRCLQCRARRAGGARPSPRRCRTRDAAFRDRHRRRVEPGATEGTPSVTHEAEQDTAEQGHGHGPAHDHDRGHSHDGRGGKIGAALREVFAPHSHDASDSIDGALESSAAGIRAVKISLLALGATSVAQLVIVLVSGSVALLADTIHNFSDALTAIPLWIAFALGTKAATRRYTYGYGRAEDI